jgi:hypothetical protein
MLTQAGQSGTTNILLYDNQIRLPDLLLSGVGRRGGINPVIVPNRWARIRHIRPSNLLSEADTSRLARVDSFGRAKRFYLDLTQARQSRGSLLTFGATIHRRKSPSRSRPAFSITVAEPMFPQPRHLRCVRWTWSNARHEDSGRVFAGSCRCWPVRQFRIGAGRLRPPPGSPAECHRCGAARSCP